MKIIGAPFVTLVDHCWCHCWCHRGCHCWCHYGCHCGCHCGCHYGCHCGCHCGCQAPPVDISRNFVHMSRTFSGFYGFYLGVWILIYILFLFCAVSVGFSAILLWFCTKFRGFCAIFYMFCTIFKGFCTIRHYLETNS